MLNDFRLLKYFVYQTYTEYIFHRKHQTWQHPWPLPCVCSDFSCIIVTSLGGEDADRLADRLAGLGGLVGCASTDDQEVAGSIPTGPPIFFCGDLSLYIFYGHPFPSADSRRAIVSFCR